MGKDAYYFSHDSNAQRDTKIVKLLQKHDWQGYGIFWAIIEMLREQKDYKLELDCEFIAYALRTHEDIIKSVVNDFGLFVIEDGFFYSESLMRRMQLKEEKSEKARISAFARWNNANAEQSQNESKAIKGKERKLNKIKLKEIESIVEIWNDFAKQNNLTKIIKLTDKRLSNVKSRLEEKEFDLGLIFDNIKKSNFLLGKNKDGWKIDFDFIFSSKNNYIKILEGKYNGKQQGITESELYDFAKSIADDPDLK